MSDVLVHKYLHRITESGELSYDVRHFLPPNQNDIIKKASIFLGRLRVVKPSMQSRSTAIVSLCRPLSWDKDSFLFSKAQGDSMINIGI